MHSKCTRASAHRGDTPYPANSHFADAIARSASRQQHLIAVQLGRVRAGGLGAGLACLEVAGLESPLVLAARPNLYRAYRGVSCGSRTVYLCVAGLENFTVTEMYIAERVSVEPFSNPLTAQTLLLIDQQITNIVDQVWLPAACLISCAEDRLRQA